MLQTILSPRTCSAQRSKEITKQVAFMIMKDMRPLNIVESPGFVSSMKYLEPGYTLPCRKTFTTLIRSHYQSAKLALKKYLEATSFII